MTETARSALAPQCCTECFSMSDVVRNPGQVGLITLNRPKALNALSLGMVRDLTAALLAWRDDPAVLAVAVRGRAKEGPFGAFCAGGDIRFLHQAALAGQPAAGRFLHRGIRAQPPDPHLPKPYIAFMDGIVMGGGMGISAGREPCAW
jgi:enoyl-CoA hydratase/carnithine racemase